MERLSRTIRVSALMALAGMAPVFPQSPGTSPRPLPPAAGGAALPGEPPSSLFATKLGDDEVELLVQGFWELGLSSTGSLAWGASGSSYNPVPLLFMQRPDLYLLLVFKERWWLEAAIADETERSTFALGFTGAKEDWVREARLGNAGIRMPGYSYLSFGDARGAFGASLSALDDYTGVAFDAMVRWDGVAWKTRRYFGLSETRESAIDPASWLRGRRFSLDDSGLESLELYDFADGYARRLSSDEYSASFSRGQVELAREPRGILYARYLYSGGTVPAYTDTMAGLPAFKLYEKGELNPREAKNLYSLPGSDGAESSAAPPELFVRSLATGLPDGSIQVRGAGGGLVEASSAGFGDPRDPLFMKPFGGSAPWIYGPQPAEGEKLPYPSDSGYEIVSRRISAVDSIRVEAAALAGSVTVTRDGSPSEAFEHDPATGQLTLHPPPRAGEDIVVRYAVSTQDRSDGALVAGAGARFPVAGGELAVGAGGRWPLPGVAFAEGGELKPAWAGVSASASLGGSGYALKAEAMVRYARAGASGRYRAAGMEDEPGSVSPFFPLAGDEADVALKAIAAESLSLAFPGDMARLHAYGEANAALEITPLSLGAISARRSVPGVPLASFHRLAFYIRKEGSVDGQLSLSLGDGQGRGAMVTGIALADLPPAEWVRVEIALDPALAAIEARRPDGSAVILAAASASYVPADYAGMIEIGLTVAAAGGAILVDEILLEGARDGFQLLGGVSASLGDARAAGSPYASLEAAGQLSESGSIAAKAGAGWILGPSSWRVDLSPAFASGQGTLGLGYAVALGEDGSANYVRDEYSRDAGLGSYARTLDGGLSLFDGFVLAKAAAASSERAEIFLQDWKASLALGGIASMRASLHSRQDRSALGDAGIVPAWLDSWAYLLPYEQSATSSRTVGYGLSLGQDHLKAELQRRYAASGPATSSLSARLSVPFSVGALSLEPSYERQTLVERPSGAAGFADDHGELGADLALAAPYWGRPPVVELFSGAPEAGFADAMGLPLSARYRAALGLTASRPVGMGPWDLLVPTGLGLSYARTLSSAGDLSADDGSLAVKLDGMAANLFGAAGASPLSEDLAFDEYSYAAEAGFRSLLSAEPPLFYLHLRHAASFETRGDATLSISNSFAYDQARYADAWSDTVGVSLGAKPGRTWFGDLLGLVLSPKAAPETPPDGEPPEGQGNAPVSAWLEAALSVPRTLRTVWALSASCARASTPGASVSIRAKLSYETRFIVPLSMSFGFRAAMGMSLDLPDAGPSWGMSYELGVDGKVSF